jgi:transposase-like protein
MTSGYVIFDGTFIHRPLGLFAAMDGVTHKILYGAYDINEGPRDLLKFCRALKGQGLQPKSATMDGNPHIFHAANSVWPTLITQRCLIHIQRQGLSWCRRHTTRTDAQHLRQLLIQVLTIRSHAHRQQFQSKFDHWNEHYGQRLALTTNRGPVTSDLQRARSMILKALPCMFSYLDDSNIPRSTNALEGYFARLKHRYRQHRGLSKRNRPNYFQWYFYLCPR